MTVWNRIFYFAFASVGLFWLYTMDDTLKNLDKISTDLQTIIDRTHSNQ